MTTFGNKYVQLLQGQPDPNNSTTYGGLASVLQRGLMGYAMGQEQKQQEASQGRLTQALQQMQGSPGTVINWNQPTRPDGTGDPTTTYGQRDPDMQGAITTLLGDPNHASLAFDLMSQDLTQRQQAEAAANELVEVPNPNGDGSYILVRAGDRMPGQISALPPAPKAPDIREQHLPDGMVQDMQLDPLTGLYSIPVGEPYPRWEPPQAAAPNYVNFANRDGQIQSVDLSTDQGRATAQALTQQGYFEVSTGVTSPTLGGLAGADVLPGPVDMANKPIAPAEDHEWVKDESGNWSQRLIQGTPSAVEAEAATAAADAAKQNTMAGAERIIGTIDEAISMVENQSFLSPVTGQAGQVADAIGAPGRAALMGALTTIKANLGFEQLQALRDASPTGGALGQVAVQELEALQATIASLDPDMGAEALLANLNKIKQHYNNVQQIIQQGGASDDDALIHKYLGEQ